MGGEHRTRESLTVCMDHLCVLEVVASLVIVFLSPRDDEPCHEVQTQAFAPHVQAWLPGYTQNLSLSIFCARV